jgi:hypothetical protein
MDAMTFSFPAGNYGFSLAPGSPTLTGFGLSAADIFGGPIGPLPGPPAPVIIPAGVIGLAGGDNIDALETTVNACPVPVGAGPDAGDLDGVGACDGCPGAFDPGQEDSEGDGIPDACDLCTDSDLDGFGNPGFPANACPTDLCPFVAGPNGDGDGDGVGDICDNCAAVPNPGQVDTDFDGFGDACDNCVATFNPGQANSDTDAFGDDCDNCDFVDNASQADSDADAEGDECDICPHIPFMLASPFDAGTLKKVQLGYKNNGPGTGDDSVKTGASFTTATAFNPETTDTVFVTVRNANTGAVLSSTPMPATFFWDQPNPAKLSWKYEYNGPPVDKGSIKEAPAGSTTYKWKHSVKTASLPGPQINPVTDDIAVTLEITPANLCYHNVLPTCTSKPLKKDSCKP